MDNGNETYELRLRGFEKVTQKKINNYRNIMQSVDKGPKPSFKDALVELVDYAYKELSVKRIEDE